MVNYHINYLLTDYTLRTKASSAFTSAEDPIALTVTCNDGNNDVTDTLSVGVGNAVCFIFIILAQSKQVRIQRGGGDRGSRPPLENHKLYGFL